MKRVRFWTPGGVEEDTRQPRVKRQRLNLDHDQDSQEDGDGPDAGAGAANPVVDTATVACETGAGAGAANPVVEVEAVAVTVAVIAGDTGAGAGAGAANPAVKAGATVDSGPGPGPEAGAGAANPVVGAVAAIAIGDGAEAGAGAANPVVETVAVTAGEAGDGAGAGAANPVGETTAANDTSASLEAVTTLEDNRGRSRTRKSRQQEPAFRNTDVRLKRTIVKEPAKAECPPDQGPIGRKPGTKRLPELSRRSQHMSLTRWLDVRGRSGSRNQREQEEPKVAKVATGIGTNMRASGGPNEQGSRQGSKRMHGKVKPSAGGGPDTN